MRDWIRATVIVVPGFAFILSAVLLEMSLTTADASTSLPFYAWALGILGAMWIIGAYLVTGLPPRSYRTRLYGRWTEVPWGGRPKLVSTPEDERDEPEP